MRFTRTRALAYAIAFVTLLGLAEFWVHREFGITAPWDRPKHVDACGRRYDFVSVGDRSTTEDTATVRVLHAVIFSLPLIPPMVGNDPAQPYAGCPAIIVIRTWSQDATYALGQGSP